MLSDADAALLRAELEADPEGMGYAAAAGDPARLAGLLATASPGSRAPRGAISRSDFLLLTLPALPRIAAASPAVQTVWLQVLETIRSVEVIRVDLPGVAGMLAAAVGQSILTQAEVDAITTVPTTRAGAVLGPAMALAVTPEDVAGALG